MSFTDFSTTGTDLIYVLAVFLLAFLLESTILPKILLISRKKHLYDIPDARKVHKVATPRLAGVSFIPIVLLSFLLVLFFYINIERANDHAGRIQLFVSEFLMLICGMILLLLIGVKDDLVGVKFTMKFRVQILAALCFTLGHIYFDDIYGIFGIQHMPSFISIPFTIFIIILVTNAINLIDGIDGLASGLSIVAAVTMGISFFIRGMTPQCMLAFACVGVLIPFFYYNVFKRQERKLFMGDTGSLALGFLLSYLAIRHSMLNPGESYEMMPILLPISVLFIPVFDVARVMICRKTNNQPLFKPDRNHIHHKLLDAGFKHRTAMMIIVSSSLALLCLNMLLSLWININIIILIDFTIGTLFYKWIISYSKQRAKTTITT